MTSGELLKRARWNAGLSPEELGAQAGVSGMTVRRIEDGHRPSAATAKKLADHFDLKPTDLFPLDDISSDSDTPDAA